MKFTPFIFLLHAFIIQADVKGLQRINFDVNSDGASELILNSTGLGIGTSPSSNLHVIGNALFSKSLSIGTTSSHSNLNIGGSLAFSIQSNDNLLQNNSYILLDSSSDNVLFSLPNPQNVSGRVYTIKKTNDQNSVWVTTSANYIDSKRLIELPSNQTILPSLKLISDGENWHILNSTFTASTLANDNLMVWWKLDELSGAIATDSGAESNHGTINSITSMGNVGTIERSFYFNGSSDYLSLGNTSSIDFKDQLTVSLWLYGDTSSVAWTNLAKKQTGSIGWFLSRSGSTNKGHLRIDTDATFNQTFTSTADIYDNSWHHICITLNNGAAAWFVDGQVDNSGNYNHGSGFASSATLLIGQDNSNKYFKGYLDDIRVYNKILTLGQIKALYQMRND